MTRLFGISVMLMFLSGCASQATMEANIQIQAIEARNLALLESYTDNPYITSSKDALPSYIEYSNAMEAAIYSRNLEAVNYLTSINAAHKVSVRYLNHNRQWARTPVNVPAAELACGVAEFDIMQVLLERYPEDKPNYTNCLHYLVASYNYYPSGHFFLLNNPASTWRDGENTAKAVEKIIALGGDPNAMPKYGRSMYEMVLSPQTNTLLKALLENGMDPNKPYDCLGGACTFLSDLAVYKDEEMASERAKLLVHYGADVNSVAQVAVVKGINSAASHGFEQKSVTALHMARFFDRDTLSATLIELGADETIADNEGNTPDSYAGQYAQIEAAQKQQAANQQAATANTHQDSGGSGLGTLMNIIGAVGAGAW